MYYKATQGHVLQSYQTVSSLGVCAVMTLRDSIVS